MAKKKGTIIITASLELSTNQVTHFYSECKNTIEMIKRSGADLDKLEVLKGQALEGSLDVRLCRGLEECAFIPLELRELVKSAVKKFKEDGNAQGLEI